MFKHLIKIFIHSFIVSYLRKCGGAFHHNPYGAQGRYIVLMDEPTYHRYKSLAEGRTDQEFFRMVHYLRSGDFKVN